MKMKRSNGSLEERGCKVVGGSSCHWPGSSNFYLVMTLPDSGNHSYLSNSEKLKIVHVPRVASTFRSLKIYEDRRSQDHRFDGCVRNGEMAAANFEKSL